jgi:hypothetical protein
MRSRVIKVIRFGWSDRCLLEGDRFNKREAKSVFTHSALSSDSSGNSDDGLYVCSVNHASRSGSPEKSSNASPKASSWSVANLSICDLTRSGNSPTRRVKSRRTSDRASCLAPCSNPCSIPCSIQLVTICITSSRSVSSSLSISSRNTRSSGWLN